MTDRLSGEVILYQREAGTTASEARLDVGATSRILGQARTESTVRHFRTVRQGGAVAKAEGEFSKYRASVDAAPSAMEQRDVEGADHADC